MAARNMSQLQSEIMAQMKKAMNTVSNKALADMYEETGDFYEGTEPKIYDRTGALGDTPRTTNISTNGDSVEFKAYLDKEYTYTTGKNPTMEDVLNLTNDGITNSSVGKLRKAIGKQGYWERAEEKMEKSLGDTMKKYFK